MEHQPEFESPSTSLLEELNVCGQPNAVKIYMRLESGLV